MDALIGGSGPNVSPPVACATDNQSATAAAAGLQPSIFLDMLIPGFSVFSAAMQRYLHVDLNVYIPTLVALAALVLGWQYLSDWVWSKMDTHLMSRCSLRTDDEAYNYVMAWVAKQNFSRRSRRFIVNTNTNSRSWFTWNWGDDKDENEDYSESAAGLTRKPLSYTPDYGSHYFFYKRTLICFQRSQGRESHYYLPSEKEELYISCFGRNPAILKDLLNEAREIYLQRDESKTAIYRGSLPRGSTSSEPTWSRCMARTSRPFSTVILNDKVKQDLIDDVTDYLEPATRRWYSNRGIPYRRGYLLHGPPGTGKSSLSLALAGFFKMRIYIVSLSSVSANEETLATLFAELPRRCVVLLEDIDSAGLTHTREGPGAVSAAAPASDDAANDMVPGQLTPGIPNATPPPANSRISLSGLLNILDGVASQEGRVLIMTTNHMEKLDKALIRPGRVDMIVHFGRADRDMIAAIFKAIYAPLEGDGDTTDLKIKKTPGGGASSAAAGPTDEKAAAAAKAKEEARRAETTARVAELAIQFADNIPAHEFSPAELQGYLMKHKRDAEAAVAGAEEWVGVARREKANKELEDAKEKRRKEEEEAKAAEEKKKKEEEEAKEAAKKKRKEERKEERKKSRSKRSAKSSKKDDDSSDSETTSSDNQEEGDGLDDSSDEDVSDKKKGSKRRKKASKKSKPVDETSGPVDPEAADPGDKAEEAKPLRQLGPSAAATKLGQHEIDSKSPKSPIGGDSGYETC